MTKFLRPLRRFVLLYDDQDPVQSEGGVLAVRTARDAVNMDYTVVAVGEREAADYGPGDRVVISSPSAGRKVNLDGVAYRLVRAADVLAVLESGKET